MNKYRRHYLSKAFKEKEDRATLVEQITFFLTLIAFFGELYWIMNLLTY